MSTTALDRLRKWIAAQPMTKASGGGNHTGLDLLAKALDDLETRHEAALSATRDAALEEGRRAGLAEAKALADAEAAKWGNAKPVVAARAISAAIAERMSSLGIGAESGPTHAFDALAEVKCTCGADDDQRATHHVDCTRVRAYLATQRARRLGVDLDTTPASTCPAEPSVPCAPVAGHRQDAEGCLADCPGCANE